MADTVYGVRSYTCSDKTKRPVKKKMDNEKLEKRNSSQRRLYITLDNIDEIFSQNEDKYPVCYDLIFNLIQGKVTKYFNGRSYDRKKELSFDCMNVLYSTLKRKLLRMKDTQGLLNPPPVLFFYLSQFFRYVELVVFSVVHYGSQDLKYFVQETETVITDDILHDNIESLIDFYDDGWVDDTESIDGEKNNFLQDDTVENIEKIMLDNSSNIKVCIEKNKYLNDKEKNVLLKIYRNSYSPFGSNSLTKRDNEILKSIQDRMKNDPSLLKDLEEILNA